MAVGTGQFGASALSGEHPCDVGSRGVALVLPGGDLRDDAHWPRSTPISISTTLSRLACLWVFARNGRSVGGLHTTVSPYSFPPVSSDRIHLEILGHQTKRLSVDSPFRLHNRNPRGMAMALGALAGSDELILVLAGGSLIPATVPISAEMAERSHRSGARTSDRQHPHHAPAIPARPPAKGWGRRARSPEPRDPSATCPAPVRPS
jgi:hypothetical protein